MLLYFCKLPTKRIRKKKEKPAGTAATVVSSETRVELLLFIGTTTTVYENVV
jgi:hypothetical protein